MLSLGSRDEGKRGLGSVFRSMEENEIEEGEAFSSYVDEDYIDPDIALSYIDEKLQDVLGHFQKDFEGGVSAENLGAKFGGYGSFLPAYQRSPSILSQPKSPPRPQNHTISKSPYNSSVENPSVPRATSVSNTNTASVAQTNNIGRKENCISSQSAGGCVPHIDSNNKPVKGGNQKSLKVRIKVGPDNTLARDNTAIYSGLGLDTPPSSAEDSPDASLGLSSEFLDAPGEAPLSILQVMTCYSVPGSYLLSPLHDSLFQLTENEIIHGKKSGFLGKGLPELSQAPTVTLITRDTKGYLDKKMKSEEKNGRSTEEEYLDRKEVTAKLLKKEMNIDKPASNKVVSSTLNMSLQSCSRVADPKAERQLTCDSAKGSSRAVGISKVLDNPLGLDSTKDDQYLSMGSLKGCGVDSLGIGATLSKGKLNSKTSLVEKNTEEINPSNQKDISSDTWREGKSKTQKSYDVNKFNADQHQGKNDNVAGQAEPIKQIPAHNVSSREKDAKKSLQVIDQAHGSKRRQKRSPNTCVPSVETFQTLENMKSSPSLVTKQNKKNSHARGDHPENKSKMLTSSKETKRGHSKESRRDVVGNITTQITEIRDDLPEISFIGMSTERSGVKKDVNLHPEPIAPTVGAATALDAPSAVVIKENWVCCDICQMWRLLPYGSDPDNLPKKWKCSMQVWLLGLNKCYIPEEETTKAFNALYLVPAPETGANLNGHHDVAASKITSTGAQHIDRRHDHSMQSTPSTGKKKCGPIIASNVPKSSISKKNQLASGKSRSLTDVNEYPLGTNSSINACPGLTSKSTDFTTEVNNYKQEKHANPGRDSDGGDFAGKRVKHSKSKNKREANQENFRISKKSKKENLDYLAEDRFFNLDMAGKTADLGNGLSAKVTGKILQNSSDHSSSKDSKDQLRGNLSASLKKSKNPILVYSNGDFRDPSRASDVEQSGTLDYAAKKRKVKEWQENQVHQETAMSLQHALDNKLEAKEPFSEDELMKQKKAKVLKREGKEFHMSNGDDKMDKKGRSTRILLAGSGKQWPDWMSEEGRVGGKGQTGYQETTVSRQTLDGDDPMKKDAAYAQLSTAATSNSSKVSGSRKNKVNLQEARGSPVESVSSSPLRTSANQISVRRNSAAKDGMVNIDPLFMGSPKRRSDGELGSDQSGTRRKETGSSIHLKLFDSHAAAESGDLCSQGGTRHYLENEASHLSGGNVKDGLYSRRVAQVDLSPVEFEEINGVGDTENIMDNKFLFEGAEKDHIDVDKNNENNHRLSNGTGQRKSDKSSSGFKERNRSSSSDANIDKHKVSDPLDNKIELNSTRLESKFGFEADFNCNDNSYCRENFKDENCNFQEKDEDNLGNKSSSTKRSHFDGRDDRTSNGVEEKLAAQKNDFNLRVGVAASCKSNIKDNLQQAPSYPSENSMNHCRLNRLDRSETVSGKGVSHSVQPSKDKSETHRSGSQTVRTPIKGNRSDTHPIDAANAEAFKVAKQSRKPDSQNGLRPSSMRQASHNGHDCSPMRKDGPSVANVVLKEARDLKHTANRLKNEGKNHESIGLYFEAALKFLYGAFLLEPPCAESAKHGETSPSMQMMQMYSDTARLCEYCALEFERGKEMGAAALAYKCVEMAYMKVAFYKHTNASKDRHELLTALQTVMPGESPSSSASDVDNLNNQGAVEKSSSAKTAASPQIVGNHVIAARNRPNFMRLLSYTNDLNCAFDATKKSQSAVAAASVNLEKSGVEDISSSAEQYLLRSAWRGRATDIGGHGWPYSLWMTMLFAVEDDLYCDDKKRGYIFILYIICQEELSYPFTWKISCT